MTSEIPQQLRKKEFRFILLAKNSKLPIEQEWQTKNNYSYDDEKVINHDGNIGVLAGKGRLRVLDVDDPLLAEDFLKKLHTFTVQTCGGTYHFYFISDYDENVVFKGGELRCKNMYVVAPSAYVIDKKKNHEGLYTIKRGGELKND